jgi:hypothetical protein
VKISGREAFLRSPPKEPFFTRRISILFSSRTIFKSDETPSTACKEVRVKTYLV